MAKTTSHTTPTAAELRRLARKEYDIVDDAEALRLGRQLWIEQQGQTEAAKERAGQ